MRNKELTIVAGPCSVDESNIEEIYQIAEMKVGEKLAITGTRVVGLKSRTGLDQSGNGMGIDFDAVIKNLNIIQSGGTINDFEIAPSVKIAKEVQERTNLLIATETLIPSVQLPSIEKNLKGKVMPWSPAVNQLGWTILEIAKIAQRNNWIVGIKNGKWTGEVFSKLESEEYAGGSPIEKTWAGLAQYATGSEVVLIHRGVDIPEKGNFRNAPVHHTARRVKIESKAKMYFDPSHSYGPKMRGDIVKATIEAMKMKIDENEYLYDGILVEAGTSKTDTEQHITLAELQEMIGELSTFRDLVGR